eukprot:TRINITY_DN5432_c0_g1_i1.p3 TRINITY_DN5432_c0_g1~~TRINITY_DN5432_c0_g1_i1.p3  ORF type:complete len:132 (+),score=9.01 TRINITY_DN5432_c0_g1_i1:1320-1715(+)
MVIFKLKSSASTSNPCPRPRAASPPAQPLLPLTTVVRCCCSGGGFHSASAPHLVGKADTGGSSSCVRAAHAWYAAHKWRKGQTSVFAMGRSTGQQKELCECVMGAAVALLLQTVQNASTEHDPDKFGYRFC